MRRSNAVNREWRPTPAGLLVIGPQELHVWRCTVEGVREPEGALFRILSKEETERAARFKFDIHRRQYVVAHVVLRRILGRYLNCPPEQVRLRQSDREKPCLADDSSGITFNLSHSKDVCLFAIAQNRQVGIDVEALEQGVNIADWTQREARVKATGRGLLESETDSDLPGWTLFDLAPGPDYAGAAAIEGTDIDLTLWDWLSAAR
jgi:4'-phosphopantetheinyl transferase